MASTIERHPIPLLSSTDQPARIAGVGIKFELTEAGAAAIAAPRPPRRAREICVCGHRGKTHDSRGRCRAPHGCSCRRLTPVVSEIQS